MKDLDVLIDFSWFHFHRPIRILTYTVLLVLSPTVSVFLVLLTFVCILNTFPMLRGTWAKEIYFLDFWRYFLTFAALWGNSHNMLNISTSSFRLKPNYLNKESVSNRVQQFVLILLRNWKFSFLSFSLCLPPFKSVNSCCETAVARFRTRYYSFWETIEILNTLPY